MADVASHRRVGRPPLDLTDPSESISLKLPSKCYDELRQRAVAARLSVPEVIRRDLAAVARARQRRLAQP